MSPNTRRASRACENEIATWSEQKSREAESSGKIYASTTIQPLQSAQIAQAGQIVVVVLAEIFEAAREAAREVKANYTAATPTTTFDSPGTTSARAKGQLL
jgi:xanthine dehydrogenase molybdopterin-binding subunit B